MAEFDFELDDDLLTVLENGRAIGAGQRFGRIFDLRGEGPSHYGPAIFDSSPMGPNAQSSDRDLLVDAGNLVILQDDPDQTVPGIFDVPDDTEVGGALVFEARVPTRFVAVDLVDFDGGSSQVVLTDIDGKTRTYVVPGGFTSDGELDPANAIRRLNLEAKFTQKGLTADATFSETAGFQPWSVVQVQIELASSGGLGAIVVGNTTEATAPLEWVRSFRAPANHNPFYSFGGFISDAGDIDGDGYGDLMVTGTTGTNSSNTRVMVQIVSGATGAEILQLDREIGLGSPLGNIDLNGDGASDFAHGESSWVDAQGNFVGKVDAYSGATLQLLWSRSGPIYPTPSGSSKFASVLKSLDDLNGDGIQELAVGSPSAGVGATGAGEILILDGATGSTYLSIQGDASSERFGSRFDTGGDIDGDGFRDIVVAKQGSIQNPGRVTVHSAKTGALIRDFTRPGEFLTTAIGFEDCDGDGMGDLAVVLSPGGGAAYSTHVLSSASTAEIYAVPGRWPVALDMDGDGFRDLVTALSSDSDHTLLGFAGRSGAPIFEQFGEYRVTYDSFFSAGDINGDGRGDLARIGIGPDPLGFTGQFVEVLQLGFEENGTVCLGAANSTGFSASLRPIGSLRVVDNDLLIRSAGIPPGAPALLLSSASYGILRVTNPLMGAENLCLGGDHITRHGVQFAVGTEATFPLDLTALPTLGSPTGVRPAVAGETRFWQAWYRDIPEAGSHHFSEALRLTFE